MADLRLRETGDGGDFVFTGKDIQIIFGLENMPYLGMFGGNYEASTRGVADAEQRFDFWGNDLFLQNDSSKQFNSELERSLDSIPLTSSGRLLLLEAVKTDLAFMNDFSEVSVDVKIVGVDRIRIELKILEPDNQSSKEFVYIWDATKQELTTGFYQNEGVTPGTGIGLSFNDGSTVLFNDGSAVLTY